MKTLLISLFIFISTFPLLGQVNTKLFYGHRLMPIRPLTTVEKELMAQHQLKLGKKLEKISSLPASVDNTSFMPPVVDQGMEGACTAFAVSYAPGEFENKTSGYSINNQFSQSFIFNLVVDLSIPQFWYFGIAYENALQLIAEAGCAKLADFQYVAPTIMSGTYCNGNFDMPSIEVMTKALKYKAVDWHWFPIGDFLSDTTIGDTTYGNRTVPGYTGINTARALLAAGQPVMMGMFLTSGYGSAMETENWVYSYSTFGQQDFVGAHALCLVGYDDSMYTKDGYEAFKVINSWGPNTFDSGYCWITYKWLAQKEYDSRFYTFTFRNNYKPEFTAEFQLNNFGGMANAYVGLENSSDTTMEMRWWGGMLGPNITTVPKLWAYRWGNTDPNFFTHTIVDLSDIIGSVDFGQSIKLAIRSYWWRHKSSNMNPEFNSIHLVDSAQHIDTLMEVNTVLNNFWMDGMCGFNPADSDTVKVTYADWYFKPTVTGIVDNFPALLSDYELAQNYPNPFNPATTISYNLPNKSHVFLAVYDLLGRNVRTLVNEEMSAGSHRKTFDASNLPSGIYFYRIKAGTFIESKKLLFLK
ncbi:MAG: T9SS type A sorting domain-containing protein [Ignavibacteriaceae bacterium]